MANIKIVSFNLHGFNQGHDAVNEMIDCLSPECFMLQEHWLTSDSLSKLDIFDGYCSVSCSALRQAVEQGPIFGRPSGGLAILIKLSLCNYFSVVHICDRFICIRIGSILFFNVYLPSSGSYNRYDLLQEILCDIASIMCQFEECQYLICGDFNVHLQCNVNDKFRDLVNNFITEHNLFSVYDQFPNRNFSSFVNTATGSESLIDYFIVSKSIISCDIYSFECCFNYSDHFPIVCELPGLFDSILHDVNPNETHNCINHDNIKHLRWDHADLQLYYEQTRSFLQPIYESIVAVDSTHSTLDSTTLMFYVEQYLNDTANVLQQVSHNVIPFVKKSFFKHWWDEELNLLKQESIVRHREWISAGKPRSGPIFNNRNCSRLRYRKAIREKRLAHESCGSIKLYDYLASKDTRSFWRSWKSKFSNRVKTVVIDGTCDNNVILHNFERYFNGVQNPPINDRDIQLSDEYCLLRIAYDSAPRWRGHIDTGFVDRSISELENGKASGPDNITAEHVKYAHPIIACILSKIFNWILLCEKVPESFVNSYTVPIPKGDHSGKSVTCSGEYRGIAISTIFSKLFELSLLNIYGDFFTTDHNQFGFRKGHGCTSAIYCARETIKKFNDGGDTANVLALDISKAFPRVNHHALLIKLIKSKFPVTFVDLLDNWLQRSCSRVKWEGLLSDNFCLRTGVNQGSVLAPLLFTICINELIRSSKKLSLGVIFVYADDILIISRTRHQLQLLFDHVQLCLLELNLCLNIDKTCCMRVGPRSYCKFADISAVNGSSIAWVNTIRYLGVFLVSGKHFKCDPSNAKKCFNRACNTILSKLLGKASEEVIMHVINVKCLPILLYGSEVCDYKKAILSSFDFCLLRFVMKIFRTNNRDIALSCLKYVNCPLPSVSIVTREQRFSDRL